LERVFEWKGTSGDVIQVIGQPRVKHTEAIVMFGGENDVFHAGRLRGLGPQARIKTNINKVLAILIFMEKGVLPRTLAWAYGRAEDNINRSPQSVLLGKSGSMMVPMALERSVPPPASRQAPVRGSNHSAR
jgi:hypothetical protein